MSDSNNVFLIGAEQPTPQKDRALAKVVGVSSGKAILHFEGEKEPRAKPFKCLGHYSPVINDRVFVMRMNGPFIVIGKV